MIFLNHKGLSDESAISIIKKKYGLALYFLKILIKSLALISDG